MGAFAREDAEAAFGVDYYVLVKLGICRDEDKTGLHYYNLLKSAHIIKAIREDETGFTAAMYGITNNNEKE